MRGFGGRDRERPSLRAGGLAGQSIIIHCAAACYRCRPATISYYNETYIASLRLWTRSVLAAQPSPLLGSIYRDCLAMDLSKLVDSAAEGAHLEPAASTSDTSLAALTSAAQAAAAAAAATLDPDDPGDETDELDDDAAHLLQSSSAAGAPSAVSSSTTRERDNDDAGQPRLGVVQPGSKKVCNHPYTRPPGVARICSCCLQHCRLAAGKEGAHRRRARGHQRNRLRGDTGPRDLGGGVGRG